MRIVLCFLLALAAAPAWAEWVKVWVSDEMSLYINRDRILKDGNFRKVWQIIDLKQRDKDGSMSFRILQEFDCREERRRILLVTSHSEPMAVGETLETDEGAGKWSAIPPGSVDETVLKRVCAK